MKHYVKATNGFVDGIFKDPSEADIESLGLVEVPDFVALGPKPSQYHRLMHSGNSALWRDIRSLEQVKEDKKTEIDEWRLKANSEGFVYQGKLVATDTLSMLDITNAALRISALQGMPADWPGGWKAGGGFIPINSVAEWNSFFNAMYEQGLANFNKSQSLKAMVNNSSDANFINTINWNSVP